MNPTITNAILAEHGNHDRDQYYPEPLTCHECCARPRAHESWDDNDDLIGYWYVTTDDPLPDGWVVLTDPTYHFSTTLCQSCIQRRRDEDEIQEKRA